MLFTPPTLPLRMQTLKTIASLMLGASLLAACSGQRPTPPATAGITQLVRQSLPATGARPRNEAEVGLGLRLFFEPKLGANNAMSCASCHQPGRGFSNGEPNALGVAGQRGNRNVPSIYGLENYTSFFWDGRAATLEEQALGPIQNPLEMNETLDHVVAKLQAVPYYQTRFREIYGTPVTPDGIARAIASFERAVELKPSRHDLFMNGDTSVLNPSEINGMGIFGRQAHCDTCHKGARMTDNKFHNLGVGFDRPNPDPGRANVTHDQADFGAFRTPSLKQMHLTGPYMHDGSQKTLEEVIEFYNKGGRPNPNLSEEVAPLNLSAKNKADLLAFLRTLESPGDNLKELAKLPSVTIPSEPVPQALIAARLR